MKLFRTDVAFGSNLRIEGLTDGQGNFFVSVRQVAIQFSLRQDNAQRDLKSLQGKGFRCVKSKIEGNNATNSVISLELYQQLVAKLANKGNDAAQNFINLLFGFSLHQLFSDAFGVKFEAEDRQDYLTNRTLVREQYHPLFTTWCQADGCIEKVHYMTRLASFKKTLGFPGNLSVHDMDKVQLRHLSNKEIEYNAYRKAGLSHNQAVAML